MRTRSFHGLEDLEDATTCRLEKLRELHKLLRLMREKRDGINIDFPAVSTLEEMCKTRFFQNDGRTTCCVTKKWVDDCLCLEALARLRQACDVYWGGVPQDLVHHVCVRACFGGKKFPRM